MLRAVECACFRTRGASWGGRSSSSVVVEVVSVLLQTFAIQANAVGHGCYFALLLDNHSFLMSDGGLVMVVPHFEIVNLVDHGIVQINMDGANVGVCVDFYGTRDSLFLGLVGLVSRLQDVELGLGHVHFNLDSLYSFSAFDGQHLVLKPLMGRICASIL